MTTLNKILWKHVKVMQPLTVDELRCLRDVDAELVRLQRLETAVMSLSLIEGVTIELSGVIAMWELMGHDAPPMYARVCRAIVKALEEK